MIKLKKPKKKETPKKYLNRKLAPVIILYLTSIIRWENKKSGFNAFIQYTQRTKLAWLAAIYNKGIIQDAFDQLQAYYPKILDSESMCDSYIVI